MTKPRYTSEEATQRYLDRLKSSNPPAAVREAIREIEDEINRSRPKKKKPRRQHPKVVTTQSI